MLLVLDIGNSTTVVGVFGGDGKKLLNHWRLSSQRQTSDEFGLLISSLLASSGILVREIDAGILSSVVPALDNLIVEAMSNYFNFDCMKVSAALNLGMEVRYSSPKEIGADRLVNAVAAIEKFGAGEQKPIIVIDYGTAITFDVISADHAYLGGVICPGLMTSIEALFGKTAKLPQVSLEAPGSIIAQSTVEAIQAGVLYGNAGMTDRIVSLINEELCADETLVVATGGHAALMARYAKSIQAVEPWLTLEGLRVIYERNSSPSPLPATRAVPPL